MSLSAAFLFVCDYLCAQCTRERISRARKKETNCISIVATLLFFYDIYTLFSLHRYPLNQFIHPRRAICDVQYISSVQTATHWSFCQSMFFKYHVLYVTVYIPFHFLYRHCISLPIVPWQSNSFGFCYSCTLRINVVKANRSISFLHEKQVVVSYQHTISS